MPFDKTTRYRVNDFTSNANITLKLESLTGDPILYVHVGEISYLEAYNKNKILQNKDYLIYPNVFGNIQTIEIRSAENICHQQMKLNLNKPNFRCSINAIVFCNSTQECTYKISDKARKGYNLLKEKFLHF